MAETAVARQEISIALPEAPYPWLSDEPSFPKVCATRGQTRQDRERPLWKLISAG
jgi:hypothetical protein